LVSVVSLYAIIKSSGNTILWGFVIIGALYLLYARKNNLLSKMFSFAGFFPSGLKGWMPVFVMFFLAIVFFFFQGAFFYAQPLNNMPHGDYAFYATVSSILANYGVESSSWEQVVLSGSSVPSPYHYFDIWLPTIFLGIMHGDTYEAFVVLSQSIYMVILSLGMIALTRKFTDNILMQLLSVLSIFFAGLLFVRILPQSSDFIFSNSCSLKYLSVSMFVLWTVLAMLEKKNAWYLPVLCLPVVRRGRSCACVAPRCRLL